MWQNKYGQSSYSKAQRNQSCKSIDGWRPRASCTNSTSTSSTAPGQWWKIGPKDGSRGAARSSCMSCAMHSLTGEERAHARSRSASPAWSMASIRSHQRSSASEAHAAKESLEARRGSLTKSRERWIFFWTYEGAAQCHPYHTRERGRPRPLRGRAASASLFCPRPSGARRDRRRCRSARPLPNASQGSLSRSPSAGSHGS